MTFSISDQQNQNELLNIYYGIPLEKYFECETIFQNRWLDVIRIRKI